MKEWKSLVKIMLIFQVYAILRDLLTYSLK